MKTLLQLSRMLLLFASFGMGSPAHAAELPASVAQALARAEIPVDSVALWTQAVDAPRPALAFNAAQAMNPASVMKLVTAFAALERFGPGHTWETAFATTGRLEAGRLEGNLHIIGGADPLMTDARLWKLLRRVRMLGIEHIDGDIVLDGSILTLPLHDPFAFDERGLRPYNSGPDGLLVHFNTLQLFLLPGTAPGTPVRAASNPPLHGLEIDNRIVTASGPCGTWHRDLDARMESTPEGPRLALFGTLPARCGERQWGVSPLDPDRFRAAAVSGLWEEVGGALSGLVRSGTTPAEAIVLFSDESPSLADVVREMNKWSSNVIARQLLAMLGTADLATPDVVAEGRVVAFAQLARAGIDTSGLVIENGSGLSRIERIRADALGSLLITAWRRAFMPEFIAALPLAGVDGTARKRLNGSPAHGQAHVKTGTIDEVRAMAGYVLDRHGQRHAVVMFVNHPRAFASQPAQDALLEWVWQGRARAAE